MNTGLYNVTNSKIMWTDIESVINRTKEQFVYSGFMNVYSLSYNYPELFAKQELIYGVITYICSLFIFIVVDGVLKSIIKKHALRLLISIPLLFLFVSFTDVRIEMYLASLIFIIVYIFVINYKESKNENAGYKIFKDNNFYYLIVSLILCYCLMQYGEIWEVLPKALLNIQFPWRLWALVQLFASMLIGILLKYFNCKKIMQILMCVIVSLFLVCNQAIIDNRASYTYNQDTNWTYEIDDSLLDNSVSMGFNKEYLLQIYFDGSYKSNYSNSLFNKVRYLIFKDSSNIEDYSYKPVVLEGTCDIKVNDAFADKHSIDVLSEGKTLIQMPMFYYEGYSIKAYNEINNEYVELEVINIDGFVSFYVEEGNYTITSSYEGTTYRKISIICASVASSMTFIALIYGIIELLVRKKQRSLQKNK